MRAVPDGNGWLCRGLSVGIELWDSVPSGVWACQRAASLSLLLLFWEESEFLAKRLEERRKWRGYKLGKDGEKRTWLKLTTRGRVFKDSMKFQGNLWWFGKKDKDDSRRQLITASSVTGCRFLWGRREGKSSATSSWAADDNRQAHRQFSILF